MPFRWQYIPTLPRILRTKSSGTRLLTSLIMLEAPKRRYRSTENEIVDDSEPERAEIRRRERKATRKANPATRSSDIPNNFVAAQTSAPSPFITEIIEISDSDSEVHVLSKNAEEHIISASNLPKKVSTPVASRSYLIPDSFDIFTSRSNGERNKPSVLPKFFVADEESDVANTAVRILDTKRFAYVSSTTSKRKQLQAASLPTHAKEDTPSSSFATNKSTAFGLSNDQLTKVSRCVCCDISWTVKKTGPQKLAHIRSCAKKHAYKDETVCILLQKEIANFVPPSKSLGKNKATKPLPEAGPSIQKTFLEEVVGEEPRKKAKRRKVETTLVEISTTRDSILARAQGILNASTSKTSRLDRGTGALDDSGISFPSQPFSRSNLAHLHGPTIPLFDMNTSPLRVRSTNSDISHRYIHTATVESSGVTPPPLEPIGTSRSLEEVWEVGKNDLPDKPTRSRRRVSLDANSQVVSEKNQVSGLVDALELVSLNSHPSSSCSSLDDAFTNLKIKSTPKKTPKTTKRATKSRSPKSTTRKKKPVDFGAKWEAHMKKHITQDTNLHQRILRYEPIHFDIFLEFATLYAPLSSTLKLQLQKFLDRQAILTYGRMLWGKS